MTRYSAEYLALRKNAGWWQIAASVWGLGTVGMALLLMDRLTEWYPRAFITFQGIVLIYLGYRSNRKWKLVREEARRN